MKATLASTKIYSIKISKSSEGTPFNQAVTSIIPKEEKMSNIHMECSDQEPNDFILKQMLDIKSDTIKSPTLYNSI